MARSKPTKKKQLAAAQLEAEQLALVEAEQGEATDDDEVIEVARPAKLAKGILVCCKAGNARKTTSALAQCPDCENCSHVECAKDNLSQEQRALLKLKAAPPGHNKTILLEGWQCVERSIATQQSQAAKATCIVFIHLQCV